MACALCMVLPFSRLWSGFVTQEMADQALARDCREQELDYFNAA